jgi:hypothetical protein
VNLPSATIAVALLFALLVLPGCQDMRGYQQGTPPPVTPAQELRAKHQYRYYPDSAVYMDTARKTFFYRNGEKWMATTLLPASVQVDWKNYVLLELDTDKPYQYHADIVKKYPPKQGKKPEKTQTEKE